MSHYKILLVEPDGQLLEKLVTSLVARFNAHITCVADAESCLDVEMVDPHDLVLAELDLEDSNGLKLAGYLMALSHRPVVILAEDPTCDVAIDAMRLGVRDLIRKPLDIEDLLATVQRLVHGYELRRQHTAKYRRMRDLVRRVIRERRDLNHRVELICRDLVGAHRRLVQRVLASETLNSQSPA